MFGFFELLIIVAVVVFIVLIANRSSRNSNTTRSDGSIGPNPHAPQNQPYQPQPPQPQPAPPQRPGPHRANNANSCGCVAIFLIFGGVFLLAAVIFGFISFIDLQPQIVPGKSHRMDKVEEPATAIAQSKEEQPLYSYKTEAETTTSSSHVIVPPDDKEVSITINGRSYDSTPSHDSSSTPSHDSSSTHTFHSTRSWFFFIGILPLLALGLLVPIIVWAIAKNRRARTQNVDGNSTYYPPRQKMGVLPWVVIGIVFLVPLLLFFGVFSARVTETQKSHAYAQEQATATQGSNSVPANTVPAKPEFIPVPVKPEEPSPEPATETTTTNPSAEDLNAELEGSGASLLMESVFRAAMDSLKEQSSNKTPPPKGSLEAKLLAQKPDSAVKAFFEGLMPSLPKNTDEKEMWKHLGQTVGKMIAAKNERPDWLEKPTGIDPKNNTYRTVVTIGPYETNAECDRRFNESIREAVNDYITTQLRLGPTAKNRIPLSNRELINLSRETYYESFMSSVGPMVRLHVELVIDSKTRDTLEGKYQASLIRDRIEWSGIALASVALCLLAALALLRFDPLYRRRTLILITTGVGTILIIGLGLLLLG